MKNQFYITTPLYYVNDRPHLGTAYTTITADVLNRFHKLFGDNTLFLTGTDEHGQKCQQAADQRGMTPQEHCNDMVKNFKKVWEELEIQYDIFFRTTDDFHKKSVQKALQFLFDQGDIYENNYEGWYSISEEIFYMEKDLIDGKSPTGREVQKISEKNYFFKMSKYQQALIDHIHQHPQFIIPETRRNEVLGFLKQSLNDLCISRPKHRLSWGIELPFNPDYVTYVWFDALLNYATGVGFLQKDRKSDFEKWWVQTGATHVLGKDILTTHAVYWTTMLFALGAPLPKQICAHGWILNKDSEKMSKSKGDVVNPLEIINTIGVDALRYFLIKDVHFGNDAPFSQDLVIQRVNNDLANNLGNLLSRTSNLVGKYFEGKCPAPGASSSEHEKIVQVAQETPQKVKQHIEQMAPSYAIEPIIHLLNEANRFLEEQAPWKQAKENVQKAGETLYVALECLRISGILLQPVMPKKCDELLKRISCENQGFQDAQEWGVLKEGDLIIKGEPLFPRVEIK